MHEPVPSARSGGSPLLPIFGWSAAFFLSAFCRAVGAFESGWVSMLRWILSGGLSLKVAVLVLYKTRLLRMEEKQFWRRSLALR